MMSPRPDRPDTVSGRAPIFSASHRISEQPWPWHALTPFYHLKNGTKNLCQCMWPHGVACSPPDHFDEGQCHGQNCVQIHIELGSYSGAQEVWAQLGAADKMDMG